VPPVGRVRPVGKDLAARWQRNNEEFFHGNRPSSIWVMRTVGWRQVRSMSPEWWGTS
jgi:hypothetical protein